VLIGGDEVKQFARFAGEAGYAITAMLRVAQPVAFGGDRCRHPTGTVEILKHRKGWVVVQNERTN
jgi:hypothetical protein